MRKIGALAANTFKENIGNRLFFPALFFGAVLIYFSLVFGVLAVDQEPRVLTDFGLDLIELFGLAAALYVSSTLFVKEIEAKTIDLILTRPLTRAQYLLGRFLGILISALAFVALMAAFHLALLFHEGWSWRPAYLLALIGIFLKIVVAAALAVAFALFSSSPPAAILFAGALWALGHFTPEMRFLAAHGSPLKSAILAFVSYFVPNFQLLNWRDQALSAWNWAGLRFGVVYSLLYSAVWLFASWLRLRRKEF